MSEEVSMAIITGICSLIVSIVVAFATSKLTLRHDMKKRIYEKREEVYIECFELVQAIKDDPNLIFNNAEFFTPFCTLRSKLNLFASQEVLDIIEPLYVKIKEAIEEYWSFFDGAEYEVYKQNEEEYNSKTELDVHNVEQAYCEAHMLDANFVENTISMMVSAMRKDMKTR